MTSRRGLAFIRRHGVVLESARGKEGRAYAPPGPARDANDRRDVSF